MPRSSVSSRVAAGDLQESIAVVGTLAPKFQGVIKAEYSGVVTNVYVTEWVHVEKGTLLARFDRREAESVAKAATAARMQATVAATRAQRELERTLKLKSAGLATQQNLDHARTAAEAAEAQLGAAKAQEEIAQTKLVKTEVRSPIDGVIAERIVHPGSYVQNTNLATQEWCCGRLREEIQLPSAGLLRDLRADLSGD